MRLPSFERYARWMSGVGLFLAGGIVGAAVFLSLFQMNMSLLHEKLGALQHENKTLQDSLDSLSKYKRSQQYIRKADVVVEQSERGGPSEDPNILNEIKRRVYEDVKKVAGVPVSAVRSAPEHFYDHVDKRVYRGVFEKSYRVTVRKLMVIESDFILYITFDNDSPSPN